MQRTFAASSADSFFSASLFFSFALVNSCNVSVAEEIFGSSAVVEKMGRCFPLSFFHEKPIANL
ncbi:hypothetical protein N749_15695 [Legionella pneumophila str. Leg01/20]|nr:hypothetical protein N749_15695 [Legionella pneumophila str. Leg01/20]